jgi:hypothetical protein
MRAKISPLLQPTERQRVGNQIDAAFVFAQADFVNVHGMNSHWLRCGRGTHAIESETAICMANRNGRLPTRYSRIARTDRHKTYAQLLRETSTGF